MISLPRSAEAIDKVYDGTKSKIDGWGLYKSNNGWLLREDYGHGAIRAHNYQVMVTKPWAVRQNKRANIYERGNEEVFSKGLWILSVYLNAGLTGRLNIRRGKRFRGIQRCLPPSVVRKYERNTRGKM